VRVAYEFANSGTIDKIETEFAKLAKTGAGAPGPNGELGAGGAGSGATVQ